MSEDDIWNNNFLEIVQFRNIHNRYPKHSENKKLSNWIRNQRARYKKGSLSQNQLDKLKEINFVFNGKKNQLEKWNTSFEEVKIFYNENKKFPSFYSKGKEKQLYGWCQNQRQRYCGTSSGGRTGKLEQWKIDKLESINFMFSLNEGREEKWNTSFEEVKTFYNEYKRFPRFYSEGKEKQLYGWCQNQKRYYGNRTEKLEQWKIDKLESINFMFSNGDLHEEMWFQKFSTLTKILEKLDFQEAKEAMNLQRWFTHQMKLNELGKLEETKKKKLEDIGVVFIQSIEENEQLIE